MKTSKEVFAIARLKIHPGKLAEFKRLQKKCLESVRTKDTGTLQYECFFSSDSGESLVLERYRDSDAMLEHFANLGDTAADIFKTCTVTGELCGKPNAKLRKALEGAPVRVFSLYQSLH